MSTSKKEYSDSKHITRKQPDFTVNQEVVDEIGASYRTLPLYEKFLFTHAYKKLYSLETNELLQCRWEERKNVTGKRQEPFQFMETRDMHFYLHACQFRPSETVNKRTDHRNRLRHGPGVDFRGQIPIPQELHMKRLGGEGNRKYPKKYPKDKKASEDAKQEKNKK